MLAEGSEYEMNAPTRNIAETARKPRSSSPFRLRPALPPLAVRDFAPLFPCLEPERERGRGGAELRADGELALRDDFVLADFCFVRSLLRREVFSGAGSGSSISENRGIKIGLPQFGRGHFFRFPACCSGTRSGA